MKTAEFIQYEPRNEWNGPAKRYRLVEPYLATDSEWNTREVTEVVVALAPKDKNPFGYDEISIFEVTPEGEINMFGLYSLRYETSLEAALARFGYEV